MKKLLVLFFILLTGCYPRLELYSQQLKTDINRFNILVVDMKFINKEEKEIIKDFYAVCITYGASGTTLDYKTQTIYQTIQPKSEVVVKNINMGFINPQTVKVECRPSSY
jgi:hypothetical protein